jgi:uncharacterized protein (TIGR00297 family)
MRFLSPSGAIAAAIVGGIVWEKGGVAATIPLLLFFITSSVLGKLPGGTERSHPRNAMQVIANGGAAAAALLLHNGFIPYLAAICAANADTWATEIGTRYGKRPVRITTLRRAAPGTSGAVSLIGIVAALLGSVTVAIPSQSIIAAVIGFGAAILDSFLGDTVQAKFRKSDGATSETEGERISGIPWMRNDQVNLTMTLAAAATAYLITS